MKIWRSIFEPVTVMSIVLTLFGQAHAAAKPSADVSIVASALAPYVRTNAKPFMVYSWTQIRANSPLGVTASDPAGHNFALTRAQTYWAQFGQGVVSDAFGRALYLAIDPTDSREYGGEDGPKSTWAMIEFQIPNGVKYINADNSVLNHTLNQNVMDALTRAQCNLHGSNYLQTVLTLNNSVNPAPCREFMKNVLEGALQVDAISYSFGASYFHECPDIKNHEHAFILISAHLINGAQVKIFTKKTADEREERIRIQSLFYKSMKDRVLDKPDDTYEHAYVLGDMPGAPKPYITQADLNLISNTTTISSSNPPLREKMTGDPTNLLWPDLDGIPFPKDLSAWVSKNIFDCQ